MDQLEKWYIKV